MNKKITAGTLAVKLQTYLYVCICMYIVSFEIYTVYKKIYTYTYIFVNTSTVYIKVFANQRNTMETGIIDEDFCLELICNFYPTHTLYIYSRSQYIHVYYVHFVCITTNIHRHTKQDRLAGDFLPLYREDMVYRMRVRKLLRG